MEEVSKVVETRKVRKVKKMVNRSKVEETSKVPQKPRKLVDLASLNDLSQISSVMYSYLGDRCLSGDIEALKYFYCNAWEENPALIRTISELQFCLTSVEIAADTTGTFNTEFLYYWGMLCMGEVSRLITYLETAETCFERILNKKPEVQARLALIELRKSNELINSEDNLARIETLRKWIKEGDFFSRIVYSKIVFFQSLQEDPEDSSRISALTMKLLLPLCQKGHPVALKFNKAIADYANSTGVSNTSDMRVRPSFCVNPDPMDKRIAGFRVNPDTLLDF